MGFADRLAHAWNAFVSDERHYSYPNYGPSTSYRPDIVRLTGGNERSIVNAIFNRIALDTAQIEIKHVKLDEEGRFIEEVNSGLNECLTLEANKDQTARAFIQDIVMTMMDEGCVAIVPVETSFNPSSTTGYNILSLRTGSIREWYPDHIKVRLYNDKTGKHQEIVVPKASTAIIQNPLYSVINERNSTMQRLVHKLALLDMTDENTASGKLDLIIQLPYVVKSEARKQQAEERRKNIEMQLSGSKYGIAYTDGTERITQLNRSVENNLMSQVEFLTKMVYDQLGMTPEVLNGSANEETMLNYYNRTIEPIVSTITDEFKRKFLSKTARTQRQSIKFYRNPFKLVPITKIADAADKFTRNEILTSNELRQELGMKPSKEPKADQLLNSNNLSGADLMNPGQSMPTDTQPAPEVTLEGLQKIYNES